jgi:hypothetical protein
MVAMKKAGLQKKWPKIEKQLQVGDILLFHNRRSLLSRSIRWRTKSYWSHTALVFKDRNVIRFGSPLIIEAFNKGIEIHKLQKYTDRFEIIDIGVKRFKGLTSKQRAEFAKSFMLNNIDVPYDYSRLVSFFFGGVFGKAPSKIVRFFQKKTIRTDAFVCSTFIHKAFHHFQKHKHVGSTFLTHEEKELAQEESIVPADIASDENFEWLFNKRK